MEDNFDLLGTNLCIKNSKGGKRYSSDDIAIFLKKFKLNEALRLIGELSYKIEDTKNPILINGIPITNSILAYISLRLIEKSNDYRNKIMNYDDLSKICDMYLGLPDPIEDDLDAESCLIRLGTQQFDYQRQKITLLPRTLLIYKQLWTTVNSNIDIESAIRAISGLNIDEILIFSAFSIKASKEKFFSLYDIIPSHSDKIKYLFQREKQQRFMNWIACRYSEIRDLVANHKIINSSFEKFRFNPLIKYPIIIPDRNPKPELSQVYILPIFRLLFDRITRGIYFELSDFFKEPGKENVFKKSFGNVFEKYIGELLQNCIDDGKILSEFIYQSKPEKKTIDWMIIEEERLILIEVKQAGLYLEGKLFGNTEQIKRDLIQSIAKGVRQLYSFEQDINSDKYPKLEPFRGKEIEKLIITYDSFFFGNSILRKLVIESLAEQKFDLPKDYHWHTISIDDFEYIVEIKANHLFNLLQTKRLNSWDDKMDFRGYLAKNKSKFSNQFLDSIWNNFFSEIDDSL